MIEYYLKHWGGSTGTQEAIPVRAVMAYKPSIHLSLSHARSKEPNPHEIAMIFPQAINGYIIVSNGLRPALDLTLNHCKYC